MNQAELKVEMPQTKVCKCCGKEKSIEEFRITKLGRISTCKVCVRNNIVKSRLDRKIAKMKGDEVSKARAMRLEDFTPRELMVELKRRGYDGELTYTVVKKINLKNI